MLFRSLEKNAICSPPRLFQANPRPDGLKERALRHPWDRRHSVPRRAMGSGARAPHPAGRGEAAMARLRCPRRHPLRDTVNADDSPRCRRMLGRRTNEDRDRLNVSTISPILVRLEAFAGRVVGHAARPPRRRAWLRGPHRSSSSPEHAGAHSPERFGFPRGRVDAWETQITRILAQGWERLGIHNPVNHGTRPAATRRAGVSGPDSLNGKSSPWNKRSSP